MEIRGFYTSQLANDYAESVKTSQGAAEISFLDFAAQAVREGKIVMPGGIESEQLGFSKAKFGFDKNIDLADVQEEEIQNFLRKIQSIVKSQNK